MNLYFLVEGKRTEKKVYPQWLSHLIPGWTRVFNFGEVDRFNYYLFSSNGFPHILDDVEKAVLEINDCGKYSHLVICVDADEVSVEERKEEIQQAFECNSLDVNAKVVIVVQNKCFETWFLGNRRVYTRNPQDGVFREYCKFYNVSSEDPEAMPILPGFKGNTAKFHQDYLKRMLKEKDIRYSKKNPGTVGESTYVEALKKRVKDKPGDLKSLQHFFNFCQDLEE